MNCHIWQQLSAAVADILVHLCLSVTHQHSSCHTFIDNVGLPTLLALPCLCTEPVYLYICTQDMCRMAGMSSLRPLRANVTFPAESGSTGQLQGQTQALAGTTAGPAGSISITDLVFVAVNGTHTLNVALPDFPQVLPALATFSSKLPVLCT